MRSAGDLRIFGIFPAECFNHAAECGVDVAGLLTRFGLPPDPVHLASQAIGLGLLQELMIALWEEMPNESLGFIAGMRIPPTAFGSFGYAFISADNLRDALEITHRYWDLVGRGVVIDTRLDGDHCVVTFRIESRVEPFLARWMVEAGVASFWRSLGVVLPGAAKKIQVCFGFPQPIDDTEVRAWLPDARHACPFTQVIFPADLLQQPFPLRSASGLQQALQQCDAQLRLLSQEENFTHRVQAVLGVTAYGFPTLEQAAAHLAISARTLRRRLEGENTSYARLLQEARLLDAIQLLRNHTLSIADVAAQLGYQDEANFCRAFRRWTQRTPTAIRQALSAAPDTSAVQPWGVLQSRRTD